jgi:Tol biopolymer transport system component
VINRLARVALVSTPLVLAIALSSASGVATAERSTRIVFSQADPSDPGQSRWRLFSVLPSGRGLTQLTSGVRPASRPLPSPDGRLILFARSSELWVMRPDGSGQRRLVSHGAEPAWKPDSRRVAYVTGVGIRTIGVNGRGDRLAVRFARSPAWSADGRTMAYAYRRPDHVDVTMRRNGREALIAERHVLEGLALSPNGRWIAVSGDDRDVAVSIGGLEVDLGFAEQPAWSPDSRLLAFMSENGLEVVDVTTTKRRLLRPHPSLAVRSLAWSPSGGEIAVTFGYPDEPATGLEIVSLAGRVGRLPVGAGVVDTVAWSR